MNINSIGTMPKRRRKKLWAQTEVGKNNHRNVVVASNSKTELLIYIRENGSLLYGIGNAHTAARSHNVKWRCSWFKRFEFEYCTLEKSHFQFLVYKSTKLRKSSNHIHLHERYPSSQSASHCVQVSCRVN